MAMNGVKMEDKQKKYKEECSYKLSRLEERMNSGYSILFVMILAIIVILTMAILA